VHRAAGLRQKWRRPWQWQWLNPESNGENLHSSGGEQCKEMQVRNRPLSNRRYLSLEVQCMPSNVEVTARRTGQRNGDDAALHAQGGASSEFWRSQSQRKACLEVEG
jgi:hypothetical protein